MLKEMPKNIIVIAGLLGAVVLGAGVIVYLLSGGTPTPTQTTQPTDSGTATLDGDGFDLKVLQRNGYKALDQRPVQDGLLPVKPPQTPGKANPFL